MLTTPALAPSPCRTVCGPWRISILRTAPRLTCARLGADMSGLLSRSPSTSTSVRPKPFSPQPRSDTCRRAGLPAPSPDTCSVGTVFARRSGRSFAPLAAMSSRVMTCTSAGVSIAVRSRRVASTMTGGSSAAFSPSAVCGACPQADAPPNAASAASVVVFICVPLSPSCEGTGFVVGGHRIPAVTAARQCLVSTGLSGARAADSITYFRARHPSAFPISGFGFHRGGNML